MKFIQKFFEILILQDAQKNYFVLTSLFETCLLVLSSSMISIFLGLGLGIILYLNHYRKNLLQKVIYISLKVIIHFLTNLPFVFFSFFMLFVVLGYLKVVDQKTLVSYVCLTFFLTLIFAKKCEQILIINNLKLKNNKKNNQQKLKFFYKVQYEIFSKINLLINSGFVYAVIISGYLKDKKIGHLFYTVLQSCISNGPESTLSLNEIPIKLENISTDLDNKTFLLSLFWLIVFITQSIYWFLHYFVKKKNCRMINIKDSVHLDSAMIDLM